MPSYDEKPENYAGCYTDFEDKDNPRWHILVTSLDDLGFYKEHVDESVTSFHVVDFSWWYLLEFQDYVSNEIRPRLQLSGLDFHGAKVNVEKNKLTIITYDDPECHELIAELINEASFDENSYEIVKYDQPSKFHRSGNGSVTAKA